MTVLLVLLGGAVGAPTRYLTDLAVQRLHGTVFPWGTWSVNVVGSLVLGVVAGASPPAWLLTLVGTGFCGALTTFSTFGFETVRLVEDGDHAAAAWNVVGSLAVGLAAVTVGWVVGNGLGQ
ncbi:fluoride efflux transporter CrcB [Nocardioides cynanchi]|uniref:fluoride efflux transporter CrcB n=1 Tax=Nocardioides cynanchi TaxID=2558918 RepID=UPI0012453AB9|nr:fluoride efflux transporter CrcB [Nocardioides cynanchi]